MIAQMKARQILSSYLGGKRKGLYLLNATNCLSSFTKSNFASVPFGFIVLRQPHNVFLSARKRRWQKNVARRAFVFRLIFCAFLAHIPLTEQ